ncbi:hypothetical protein EKG38_16475 [Shewanella canadensis]|uniref:Uncharacterized protein n=1 Tax=Shewanella canadensis TaxID=271096 RepID=A0A431WRM7_9GAMM|nr:hypothetical protein [Shewanella canadensis]RTR37879.1 hypothetical protein EKG38_16475 [Shewanella canadensis]
MKVVNCLHQLLAICASLTGINRITAISTLLLLSPRLIIVSVPAQAAAAEKIFIQFKWPHQFQFSKKSLSP